MMKKLAYLAVVAATLAVTGLGMLLAPAPASAWNPFGTICNQNPGNTGSSAVCLDEGKNQQNPLTGPNGLFRGVANIIALVAGITAVILIIIAGLKYITAGGDAAKVKSASGTLVGVVIGLIIIALAGSIISFVLGRL